MSSAFIAGTCDSLMTYPFDFLKTKKQLNSSLLVKDIYKNLRKSNTSLYKGFMPYWGQIATKTAIRFSIYEYCMKTTRSLSTIQQNMFSGFMAGFCESIIIVTPLERIKIYSQNNHTNFSSSIIIKKYGILNFWKGLVPTTLKQSISLMVRFTIYSQVSDILKKQSNNTNLVSFLSGGFSGVISVLINNPIDIVKTRIQSSTKSNTIFQNFKTIYNVHGIPGYFSGLSIRIPRVFISQAVTFSIYNFLI